MPVYVLATWTGPRSLAGWGGSEVRPTSIAVMHGDGDGAPPWARVALDTGDGRWEGPEAAARDALSNLLHDGEWPLERSRPALTVWLKHREREALRIVSRAEVSTIQIGIDGIDHPAAVVHHDPYLAAVIDAPPGRITISAHGVAARDLGLVRLEDPGDALAPLRPTPRPPC